MTKPSWLFWTIAALSLLWGAHSVVDYVMTTTGNEKYLKHFDPKMIEWILGFPAWRKMIWLAGVASGVLGAIMLLARRRVAAPLFLISVAAMFVGFIVHDLLMANGVEMYGSLGLIATGVLAAVQIFFFWYATRAARQGYLA